MMESKLLEKEEGKMIEIINYDKKYEENVKDLLVELQEYIVSIDKDHYNILTDKYREKYFAKTMQEVKKYHGKIFLAKDSNKIVGLIAGVINNEEEKTLDFQSPKRGRVTELVVTREARRKGIGKKLLAHMEEYFQSIGCKAVLLGVFGYNEHAKDFYHSSGYKDRYIEVMKKIQK